MSHLHELLALQERYRDRLRDLESNAPIYRALAADRRRQRIHRRALTWLGVRLIGWGHALQARHQEAYEASLLRTANKRTW